MANLFVALVPPPAVVEALAAAVEPVRVEHPDFAWARREAWHLTLAFLGPAQAPPDLEARLARVAARHAAPTLALAEAGRFGSRVLWVRIGGDDLRPLAAGVARAATKAGYVLEDRAYKPHLTLARSRRQGPGDLRPLVAALAVPDATWSADRLVLLRGPARPEYEEVAGWPLRASTG